MEGANRRMGVPVCMFELSAAGCNINLFGMSRSPIHGPDGELLAITQWVMDEVIAGSAPQHDAVAWDINLDLSHRHNGAKRRITRRARLTVTDKFGTDERPDTICPDQSCTGKGAAIYRLNDNIITTILEIGH